MPTARWGERALAAALLLLVSQFSVAHHEPDPGMYFDPAFNGHGLDLHRAGEIWFVLFYTYGSDNTPVWYLAAAPMEGGVLETDLLRFRYNAQASPPQQVDAVVGTVRLDFSELQKGNCHLFDWMIDGESGNWCVQRLIASEGEPVAGSNWSGNWFAGLQDEGWGLSVHFQGAEDLLEFLLIYFYDAAGFPRWGLGVNAQAGPVTEVSMDQFSGYCRSCTPTGLTTQPMGTVSHVFSVDARAPTAVFNVDVDYQGSPGGSWERTDTAGELASNFAPGLIPFPDKVDNDTPIAIEDVTVVPMDGQPKGEQSLLHHQSVVIQDGLIAAMGPRAEVTAPGNAVKVDGRGYFLGPGLSEMHLHTEFGGEQAAEESGVLMIATGVTAALNMGDAFTMDVPGLDDKFESGELIGPTFYTGQVAYGTSDNARPQNTVGSPAQATAYADQLFQAGYDYIKVYTGLTPGIMDQFAIERERLSMPMAGHLPLSQSAQESFMDGQQMAAHAQEPWKTLMNRTNDEALAEAAAQVFLDHGIYLTPTIAVFQSFAMVFGGVVEAFNDLSTREGWTYTAPGLRNAWRTFFQGPGVQGQGQQPGGFDEHVETLKMITRVFGNAGVPLLVGTDAPAFPGVMSGFGAYWELQLFEEAGLTPEQIYRAASANAGDFVADTLGGVPFGAVVVGNRADLILVHGNPLESVAHLHRPPAVIARGRFWTQAFLTAQLNAIAKGYGINPEDTSPEKVRLIDLNYPNAGVPYCSDHLFTEVMNQVSN